jgi:hypothetical protein
MLSDGRLEELRLLLHGPPAPLKEAKPSMVESMLFNSFKTLNLDAWQNKNLVLHRLQNEAVEFAKRTLPDTVAILDAEKVLADILRAQPELSATLRGQPANRGVLTVMSASTFFWMVYMDGEVSSRLPAPSRLLIGNALLFALWKEETEYMLMEHAPVQGLARILPTWLNGAADPHENSLKVFDLFCRGTLHDYIWETPANFRAVLYASSWSGIFQVCKLLKQLKPPILAENLVLRKQLLLILSLPGDQLEHFIDYDKRVSETQFKLGLAVVLLAPKHEALRALARRVLFNYETIDVESSAGSALKGLLLMAERLQADGSIKQRVQDEVSRVALQTKTQALAQLRAPEVSDAISSLAAATIAGTVEKLLVHVWESESIRLLIGMLLGARTGFYLSTKPQLINSLSSMLLSLAAPRKKYKVLSM